MRNFLFLLCLTAVIAGCRNHDASAEHSEEAHAHASVSVAYTVFSDSCEYFAEIQSMVKGEPATGLVHITRLSNHKPLASGILSVRLLRNGQTLGSGESTQPRVPGIFPVTLTPSGSGDIAVQLIFSGEGITDTLTIDEAKVWENDEEAEHAETAEENAGVVRFTKEMAWKTDFKTVRIDPKDFYRTIRVSGELQVPPSDIATLTAKGDGILVYRKDNLVPGTRVEPETVLFTLTGKGLTSRSMTTTLTGMKSRFEVSRAAYEREKELVKDRIVSMKQFEQTTSAYRTDSNQYFSLLNGLSGNSMNISSGTGGSVIQLLQPNGSFVTEGTPLATLGSSRSVLLRADVPQRFWKDLPLITNGAFRIPGEEQVYKIAELGGRLLAKGDAASPGIPSIPVTFTFSNPGVFLPGSLVEAYLYTNPVSNQLVVPVSALIEEQGLFFVYVQTGGESYVKRNVAIGFTDGASASISSGLNPGDRVVTRGAIFIKAASQMGGATVHSHEH